LTSRAKGPYTSGRKSSRFKDFGHVVEGGPSALAQPQGFRMKTERRHELQTNTLAVTLAHWIEAAKPYSRAALALVIALVVALFSWSYLSHQNARTLADGWSEYFDALNRRDPRDRLADVSQQYAGTPVAQWARLTLADLELDQGTNRLFVEKKDGRDELKQAVDKFQTLLAESHEQAVLERATYGLARAHEALGVLDKAREEYRKIAQTWPDSPLAPAATSRADDLDRAVTKSFYDWFAKYEPPRAMTGQPGVPGARPDFLKDPLESGGIKLPELTDDKAPRPDIFAEPAGEKTTEPSAEPATEKPETPAEAAPESGAPGDAAPESK
jgi:tetratricopeptide (TPR) repeat protein